MPETMHPGMLGPLVQLLAGFCLAAMCSGFETGMYSLSPIRLRVRTEDPNDRAARIVQRMLERRDELLVGLLVGNNLAHYLTTAAVLELLIRAGAGREHAESYATLILTPALFVFGEMVPKNLFRENADRLAYRWAGPVRLLLLVLRACGLVWLVKTLAAAPARLFRTASASEALSSREAVRSMVLETTATGLITPYQAEMANNVLGISSITLRTVMVPLARVVMISENYSRDEFRQLAAHFTVSQVPVFSRTERARLIGMVNVVEGLIAPAEGWTPAGLMRPLLTVPVTTNVIRALQVLREHRAVMAAVVDSTGRALGIVTMKDLVEEIVGELGAW